MLDGAVQYDASPRSIQQFVRNRLDDLDDTGVLIRQGLELASVVITSIAPMLTRSNLLLVSGLECPGCGDQGDVKSIQTGI
jgi:hypothetical protein